MLERAELRITPEEYLAMEEPADRKSEYYDGRMYLMSGGTDTHSGIAANIIMLLGPQLWSTGCRVRGSDLRVKVEVTGLYTYPDVGVVCGPGHYEDAMRTTLLNPVALFEVLSDSTEAYDRGTRFEHYRQIPALREYVLVSTQRRAVEVFSRTSEEGTWTSRLYCVPEATVELASVSATLPLEGLYRDVLLPAHAPLRPPTFTDNE